MKEKKKRCSSCGKEKNLSLFVKWKGSADGTHNQCKQCRKQFYYANRGKILASQKEHRERNRESISKQRRARRRTKHGRIMQILKNIEKRCNNPLDAHYHRYGGRGIKNLLSYDDLGFLWDRDNACLMIRPSIDRIDVDGNYDLSNCQFLEFAENTIKDSRRKVKQFDKRKNLVKTWDSISEAERNGFHHGNIIKCCQGKRLLHKGFSWKYFN